jgi:predicted transposase YdaD
MKERKKGRKEGRKEGRKKGRKEESWIVDGIIAYIKNLEELMEVN